MTTPLAIAFTPNYIVPAAAMLRSLLDSSTGGFRVVCLVTEEIPQGMQEALLRLGGGRLEMQHIPLRGRLEGLYVDPRYTEAASFRLLLPELLPEFDKILYLDCDIIVRQDMGRLYAETDLTDNYLAAVYEAPIEGQAARIEALGCTPGEYFNSGMLLMNLRQMREEKVSTRLLEACRVPYLEFPDQDALNHVCRGRVLPLSPLYNSIRTFFLPRYRADFEALYGPLLWSEVQRHSNIHYTGGKPWNIHSVQFLPWWQVYDSLPQEIKALWKAPSRLWRTEGVVKDALRKLKR